MAEEKDERRGDEDEERTPERLPDELVRSAGAHGGRERQEGRERLRKYLEGRGTRDPRGESERIGTLAGRGKFKRAHRAGEEALATRRKKERRE